MAPDTEKVRLDKWLWAARFYKTRSAATDAIDGGKVDVNGEGVKPAKLVKPGDVVRVRMPPFEHIVVVRGLGERRGSAAAAQALYEETPQSVATRERLRETLKMAPAAFVFEEGGRPTKKDRRDLQRFIDRKRR
jgi:ribosome-associated heat shock protein Hsp15